MSSEPIYHICQRVEWEAGKVAGAYRGSSQDISDGFIHFSTGTQVRRSAAKHRAGQSGLVLLTVEPNVLGNSLKWEPSRDGEPFPHLYGTLQLTAVLHEDDLPLGPDGLHVFPPAIPLVGR
ncbi:MAG: DUF952 domain-containing protein [Verrucomicrobia bacterium]|nr:DUF952 domain-containing protein [Verrucomicrobiota bacterium]